MLHLIYIVLYSSGFKSALLYVKLQFFFPHSS